MTGKTIMYDPEIVKFEWPELDEEKIVQDAQKKLEDQLKIEALEDELKLVSEKMKRYQRVICLLIEAGAVSSEAVLMANKLLDEVMVNKSFSQVGITKTSKPPRKIKFPLSSQVDEGKGNYDLVDGLWGFNIGKPEFSKKGFPMSVNVIDKDGETFTENLGNGSVVTLKLFGYKNQDGQLTVTLDTVQVLEHVPYEGKGSSDSVEDDVLGVSYKVKKTEAKPVEQGNSSEEWRN